MQADFTGQAVIKWLKDANVRVSEAVADRKQYDTFGDLMKRAKLLGADRDFSNAIAGRRRSTRVLRALRSYFAMSCSFLHRFVKVAPHYAKIWQFLPVLFIGLMFQIVAASAQFVSAVTANLGEEKDNYNELLEIAKVSS